MNVELMELGRLREFRGGAIAICVPGLTSILAAACPVQAQTLILDGTTGPAQTLTGPVYEIEQALGTTAGANLFHSFEQFDLATGEQANFRAAPEVRNILTRVTGGEVSTIDGVLATPGSTADFYLINPVGVVFGPDGKLELGGSFIGTTASAVRFGELGEFSAVQPQPADLLNIQPSALQFAAQAGRIESQSVAQARPSVLGRERFGLQVPDGESLLLVGGDVEIDGGGVGSGGLLALGGRLELGGLAEAGEVQLTQVGQTLGLQYPQDVAIADVLVTNNALVNVTGNTGGGDLVVTASRLEGSFGGRLVAGTDGAGDAGDLIINAKEIEFRGGVIGGVLPEVRSGASNEVVQGATGNGGELRITGDRLRLSEGAQMGNSIFGLGSSGPVQLALKTAVQIDSADGTFTGIFNDIQNGSPQSTGGDILIQTQSLDVMNGGLISTSLFDGEGQAGAIQIEAQEINIIGLREINRGFIQVSAIDSLIGTGSVGNGGDITINTDRLNLLNGAQINTTVFGRGQGGEISINAQEFANFSGQGEASTGLSFASGVTTGLFQSEGGKSGDITIRAPLLSIDSGGFIVSETFGGIGQAGDITLDLGDLKISQQSSVDGFSGRISSATRGTGDAGKIMITANNVYLSNNGVIRSSVIPIPSLGVEAIGNGGTISIQAKSLALTDSLILSNLQSRGERAGDIVISIDESATIRSSTISPFSIQPDQGQAGNLSIAAGSLRVIDSDLFANTFGPGTAGSVTLRAEGDISLEGRTRLGAIPLSGDADSRGTANDIRLQARTISAGEDVEIATFTTGRGNAGNIEVQALDSIAFKGSRLLAGTTSDGEGGNIVLEATSIALSDKALIQTITGGSGNAGKIQVNAAKTIALRDSNLDATTAGDGAGGDILLRSPTISLQNRSLLIAESRGRGKVGSIDVQANTLAVRNNSEIVFSAVSPEVSIDGGSITIDLLSALLLEGDSGIFATAADQTPAGGSGGSINIKAPFLLSIPGKNGDISTSGIGGDGGRINIDAEGVFNFKIAPQNGPTAAELRQNTDNDISSNSQVTQGGTVLVSGFNVDPTQGAAELPTDFTDPSQQIAQRCAATAARSSFISTGRSGIPLNPTDAQTLSNTEADWAALPPSTGTAQITAAPIEPAAPLTEVTHWQRDKQGSVTLLAAQPQRPAFDSAHCTGKR